MKVAAVELGVDQIYAGGHFIISIDTIAARKEDDECMLCYIVTMFLAHSWTWCTSKACPEYAVRTVLLYESGDDSAQNE